MKHLYNVDTIFGNLRIIRPKPSFDHRGYSFDIYNTYTINMIADLSVKEIRHIYAEKRVFEGLHYYKNYDRTRLITVTKGSIINIVIDVNRDSKTFGLSYISYLDDCNRFMFYVPKGFAYGFIALEDSDILLISDETEHDGDRFGINYKDVYNLYNEQFVIDKGERIPFDQIIINNEDKQYKTFKEVFGIDIIKYS